MSDIRDIAKCLRDALVFDMVSGGVSLPGLNAAYISTEQARSLIAEADAALAKEPEHVEGDVFREFVTERGLRIKADARIAELEAQLQEAQRDAARYRWLRDEGQFWGQLQILFDRRERDEWDESIDNAKAEITAAMEASNANG